MNRLILLLGGNEGDRFGNLFSAMRLLSQIFGEPVATSGFYLTEPYGIREQPWFLNVCQCYKTGHSPGHALSLILTIEKELGRKRLQKWGPRTIDIDILDHGGIVLSSPELQLPHPGIAERRFVLEPLAGILPDWMHPALLHSAKDLLNTCAGTEKVIRL